MKMKITVKWPFLLILLLFIVADLESQTGFTRTADTGTRSITLNRLIEIRSYNLKPGTRNEFHKLFIEQALPILTKWKIDVVDFGPSVHDSDSYFLVRSYKDLQDMQQNEALFYGSDDWKKGPREAILALILNYTTIVLQGEALDTLLNKLTAMEKATLQKTDAEKLSELNKQFIRNFINHDVKSHNEIIHRNFVCIEGDGSIVDRETYMMNWATDFTNSGYTSFSYGDEQIRLFGNVALVRSKTTYTKIVHGKNITGHSVYTDTYIKENGRWWCVQAQITPVKNE
jgi:hypothetical protein